MEAPSASKKLTPELTSSPVNSLLHFAGTQIVKLPSPVNYGSKTILDSSEQYICASFGKKIYTIENEVRELEMDQPVLEISLKKDQPRLGVVWAKNVFHVINVQTNSIEITIRSPAATFERVNWVLNTNLIGTCGGTEVILWRIEEGSVVYEKHIEFDSPVRDFSFDLDKKLTVLLEDFSLVKHHLADNRNYKRIDVGDVVMTPMVINQLALTTRTELRLWNIHKQTVYQTVSMKNTEQPKIPAWSNETGLFVLGEVGNERLTFFIMGKAGVFSTYNEFALQKPCTALTIRSNADSLDIIALHADTLTAYSIPISLISPPDVKTSPTVSKPNEASNPPALPPGKIETKIEEMYNKFESMMAKGLQDQVAMVKSKQAKIRQDAIKVIKSSVKDQVQQMFYRAVEKTINDQFLEVSGLFTDHLSRIVEAGDQEFVRVQAIQTHLQKTSDFLVQVGQKINTNIERKVDGIIDKSHRTVVEAEVNELISKQKYGEAVERVIKDPELLIITLKAFNIETFLDSGVLTSSDLMEVARSLSLGIQLVDDNPIALDWLKSIEAKLKFGFSDNHICLEIITNLENYVGANLDAINEIRDRFLAKQIQ